MVVAVMSPGPMLGWLVGAHPWHRSTMVLTIVAAIVVVWTVVLPGPATRRSGCWCVLVVVVGVGGPASMIGFDVGRTSNPAERLASASGIINQGGFVASLVLVIAIGLMLDWRTPGGSTAYTPVGVPLGDERAVRPVGARPHPGLPLPASAPGAVVDRDELEGVVRAPASGNGT